MAGKERRRRLGAVLRRLRRLQAPRAGERRSPDPALGVPHLLHALPAGDRAGHAAIPVRVPDPGGDADRHGGRQRLHVRRLDRRRRGGADGAPRDQAAQGGALPATCIRTIATTIETVSRLAGDAVVALPPAPARPRDLRDRIDDRPSRASSCRRRTSSAICSISSRSPRRRTPPARC